MVESLLGKAGSVCWGMKYWQEENYHKRTSTLSRDKNIIYGPWNPPVVLNSLNSAYLPLDTFRLTTNTPCFISIELTKPHVYPAQSGCDCHGTYREEVASAES
jgi:hypothetical protein